MDREEARAVARAALAELRQKSWGELRDELLARPRSFLARRRSRDAVRRRGRGRLGRSRGGNLRVLAAVDDGRWRARLPVTDEFIVTPDRAFVGA
jgi:hypothetical protein